MDEDLDTLAAALVRKPFDAALRRRYADALEAAGRREEASEQYALLGETEGGHAAGAAPGASGEPDSDTALGGTRDRARGPVLRVLPGGKKDEPEAAPPAEAPIGFADIVGMDEVKKQLQLRVIEPFRAPGLFARFKKRAGGGFLLYGPPGCGKTMMARAVAHECGFPFHVIGISDVLTMWQGESERNLASFFERARAERPAVLFFDEIDALAFARSKMRQEYLRTLVNELLAQLDGMQGDNDQILVLGASNRPWDVDDAMRRPGRFDRAIFVPPPDAPAREAMFRNKLRGVPTGDLDLKAVAAATRFCSGADIDGIVEEAKEHVLGSILETGRDRVVEQADLLAAAAAVEPSTLPWLQTARNLVKYGGRDRRYKDVEQYLARVRF